MNKTGLAATLCVCVTVVIVASKLATGGDVSPPPGAVAPTMRTLDEIYDAVQTGGGAGACADQGPVTAVEPREECFIRISGIDGEDVVLGQTKVMRVVAIDGGVSFVASSGGGGSGGVGVIDAFAFYKRLDKASPSLMLACADDTPIMMVTVHWVRAGAIYATTTLEDVSIESARVSATHDGCGGFSHLERIVLLARKVTYQYQSDPPKTFDSIIPARPAE